MAKRVIKFWRYYKEWIETYKKRQVRPITYAKYELTAKLFKDEYPDLYLHEMDRRQYQKILNKYGETHEIETTRDFKRKIDNSLQDAHYEGWIKKDPTFNIIVKSTAPVSKKRPKFLEVDETDKLAAYFLKHPGYYSYFLDFILRTGVRFAEALGFTLEDVDFDNLTVNINKTWDYKKNTGFMPPKSESSKRIIAIDEMALNDIRSASFGVKQEEPLFVAAYTIYLKSNGIIGERKTYNGYAATLNPTFNDQLFSICEKINIPVISIHGLRHTHGSYMLAKGMDAPAIQRRLGHSRLAITERIYLHLLKELREKDNEKIVKTLNGLDF